MERWIDEWVTKKYEHAFRDGDVRTEDFGALSLSGEIRVWHPIDDLHAAPRFALAGPATVQAVWVRKELAGYVLRSPGTIASWRDVGDASASAVRFFLVEGSQVEPVIDWLNEDPMGFEELGGDALLSLVSHSSGASVVVLQSFDGNAIVRAGSDEHGNVVCAVIET
jgi:hypothetical protein